MGLFFNNNAYYAEGPGVSKDEAQKRGVIQFFERYFRSFGKLLTANLLYILVSLPLVTTGLAGAGLAYTSRAAAKDKYTFAASDFFDSIKKNWRKALPVGLINTILTLLMLYFAYFSYVNFRGGFRVFYISLLALAFVLFTFMKFYHYIMVITFDFPLWNIYKNSMMFAFLGIKRNLVMAGTLAVCYGLAACAVWWLGIPGLSLVFLGYVVFFPAFKFYIMQYNAFPIIKKHIIDPYYEMNPDADIELRREIGVYDEEDDEDEE